MSGSVNVTGASVSDTDDEGFIGLPPGMMAPVDSTSGTIKRDRPERPRAGRDEIVFFPVVPGTPSIAPAPAAEDTVVEIPAPAVDDATSIRVSRHSAPGWRLVIDGRESVAVGGPLYLGRSPIATAGHPQASVFAVDDAAKSVSKTHALLELDGGVLWVSDLDSTNGVWVVPAGEDAREVLPGTRAEVPAGADLQLGDLVIQVECG